MPKDETEILPVVRGDGRAGLCAPRPVRAITRSRPLCRCPLLAKYKGTGTPTTLRILCDAQGFRKSALRTGCRQKPYRCRKLIRTFALLATGTPSWIFGLKRHCSSALITCSSRPIPGEFRTFICVAFPLSSIMNVTSISPPFQWARRASAENSGSTLYNIIGS